MKDNPYQVIVARNAFGLRQAPPPEVPGLKQPPPASVDVVLTGISTLGGTKKVLIQITDKSPGMKPDLPPPLEEGEVRGRVEIVSIDPDKSEVMIKLDGQDKKLTFEKAKSTASSGPSGAPPNPFVNPAAPIPGIPLPTPAGIPAPAAAGGASVTAAAGGRYGVVTGGGSAPSVPSPVTPTAVGGVNVGGMNAYGAAAVPSIPTRPLRIDSGGGSVLVGGGGMTTANPTTPQAAARTMTREEAIQHVNEQRKLILEAENLGLIPKGKIPPLPPAPGWPPQGIGTTPAQ
jgi:hypothetical protein